MSTKQFQECILLPKQEYEKILNKKNQQGGSLLPLDGPQVEDVKSETRRYIQEAEGDTRLIERIKDLEAVLYQILVERKKPPTGYTTGDLLAILRKLKARLVQRRKNKKTVKNEVNIVQIPDEQNQDEAIIIRDMPGPSQLKTPKTTKKVTRSSLKTLQELSKDYTPTSSSKKMEESLKQYSPESRKILLELLKKKQIGKGIKKKRKTKKKKSISKKTLRHWKEVR